MHFRLIPLFPLMLLMATAACDSGSTDAPTGGDGDSADGNSDGDGTDGDDGGSGASGPGLDPLLVDREVDYNEALRTASLKLVRRLPTLTQIKKLKEANDPRGAYIEELDAMLDSPAFSSRMVKFWRDAMRMGGAGLDGAPNLAAQLMVEGGDFTQLFTAESGNCPTFDGATGTFTAVDCASNAPAQAGVLTDPGVQSQFYGNMAFRRVRWVQEIFLCTKFPSEYAATPTQIEGKDYTAPWAFDSIATDPINFQDAQSVVCANCHTTMNHIAPLFANFDENGMWQNGISVQTPIAPEPVTTELSHWLKEGEQTAWRLGQPVADLPALGQALAEDPDVAECMAARLWNFTMSKEDIVADLATVPYGVIEPFILDLDQNRDLKKVLRDMMISEDFVSF